MKNLVDVSKLICEPAMNCDIRALVEKVKPDINEIVQTVNRLKSKGQDVYLSFLSVNEIYNVDDVRRRYNHLFSPEVKSVVDELLRCTGLGEDKLLCILNDATRNGVFTEYGYSEYLIPWFMYTTHYLHDYMQQEHNNSWNCSKRILFTPGKLHKWHRLFVLMALDKLNLLNEHDTLWSAMVLDRPFLEENNSSNPPLHQALNHSSFCKDYYMNFYHTAKKYEKNLDVDLDLNHQNGIDTHYTGFPYDYSIYADSGFSIICQTELANSGPADTAFLTEKEWRAIHNKHPFMIVGDPRSYSKLVGMGFKTFEHLYKPDPEFHDKFNYTNIFEGMKANGGCDWFIDNLASQISNFRNNILAHENEIREAVEHNYTNMLKLCESFRNQIEQDFKMWRLHDDKIVEVDIHNTLLDNAYRNVPRCTNVPVAKNLYSDKVLNQHPKPTIRVK